MLPSQNSVWGGGGGLSKILNLGGGQYLGYVPYLRVSAIQVPHGMFLGWEPLSTCTYRTYV